MNIKYNVFKNLFEKYFLISGLNSHSALNSFSDKISFTKLLSLLSEIIETPESHTMSHRNFSLNFYMR